ncbi:MAG: hypothetical protein OEY56_13055 [Cyclobacteriaceae bacterium]|nr:hypothetical protein [Cyclobacteriaceae bacterium]
MEAYFKNTDLGKARGTYLSDGTLDVGACMDHCLITKTSIHDLKEYHLHAYCMGNQLFNQIPPYLISGEVNDELFSLLSNETIDFYNDFFTKHFSPDPNILEPNPTGRIIIF